jgi:antitoxin FitA
MAQLIVRNIDDDLKARLQRRAAQHGQSMEAEVRDILRDAVKQEEPPSGGLGSEIAAMFRGGGGFKEGEIPELRGDWIKPANFEE